jgi:serine/threonine protein phosphatase 1
MISDPNCYQQMMWGRKILRGEGHKGPVTGVDITLHGHTPVLEIRRIANRYFIDTGAGMGEHLTVRNIETLVTEYRNFKSLW